MTTVSAYEVTSIPPIGISMLPPDASSSVRWRMLSQRTCKPKSTSSRIRSFKRFGIQQGSEPHIASLWKRRPGSRKDASTKPRRAIQRSAASIESRNGDAASGSSWQSSVFGGVDMLVSSSLMVTNVQANMVLMTVTVALVCVLLAMLVLLGLSILCHPLWIVRWTQKLQPHVLYLKPTQEKIVALTLDDGPHAHITPQLLDILRENDCKATWFVIGNHMEPCPDIVERIHAEGHILQEVLVEHAALLQTVCTDVKAGHEVANHTMEDVASWTLSKKKFEAQLVECDNRLKNFFHYNSSGQPLKWFRPGHGFYSSQIVQTCKEHGYRIALGSLYPMDHMFVKQAKLLAKNMLWRIHPGAIIILHDRVPQYAQTPEVLRLLLPELKKRGYKIVTLSELDGFLSNAEMKTRSD